MEFDSEQLAKGSRKARKNKEKLTNKQKAGKQQANSKQQTSNKQATGKQKVSDKQAKSKQQTSEKQAIKLTFRLRHVRMFSILGSVKWGSYYVLLVLCPVWRWRLRKARGQRQPPRAQFHGCDFFSREASPEFW